MDRDERRVPERAELGDLMAAYQQGDLPAFEALYARLAPALRRFLLSLTHDPTWTDDLVQEAFLQMHRSRQTYHPNLPVEPWAFAIARHVFLMSYRTRRRKGDFSDVAVDQVEVAGVRAHDVAIVARDRVMKAMHGLSPGIRRVVWLHHVAGWSFADVAARVGIREPAAKLRASRGMAILRRTLRDTSRTHHV
jgi:RNA polymerase sigma-70 factor, ECF subfamily